MLLQEVCGGDEQRYRSYVCDNSCVYHPPPYNKRYVIGEVIIMFSLLQGYWAIEPPNLPCAHFSRHSAVLVLIFLSLCFASNHLLSFHAIYMSTSIALMCYGHLYIIFFVLHQIRCWG